MFYNSFSEILGVYETVWKNVVEPDKHEMTIYE